MTDPKRILCGVFAVLLLSGCAWHTRNAAPLPPFPPVVPPPVTGSSVGDSVTLDAGTARVEEVYISALGQHCRKLALSDQSVVITECYDGNAWYPVKEIAGRSPIGK